MLLPDPDHTFALGERIGRRAHAGQAVALIGDLGVGKSILARGMARGLGLRGRVPSPTFVLVHSYFEGRLPFHHVDLYRLEDEEELEQLGLDELLGDALCAIEWADRFPRILPDDHLWLALRETSGGRLLEGRPTGPRSAELWRAIR